MGSLPIIEPVLFQPDEELPTFSTTTTTTITPIRSTTCTCCTTDSISSSTVSSDFSTPDGCYCEPVDDEPVTDMPLDVRVEDILVDSFDEEILKKMNLIKFY